MEYIVENLSGLRFKALLASDLAAPVIYLIHGRAGDRDVMWAFKRVIPETFNIVSLEAQQVDPEGGYSWWQVKPVLAEKSSLILAAETVHNFILEFERHYKVLPSSRLAMGFSQGAGLLSILLQRKSNMFSGMALLAGFVIPVDRTKLDVRTRVFMAHGTEDNIIPVAKAREGYELLQNLGISVEWHEDPVTHKIGAPSMRALKNWLTTFA